MVAFATFIKRSLGNPDPTFAKLMEFNEQYTPPVSDPIEIINLIESSAEESEQWQQAILHLYRIFRNKMRDEAKTSSTESARSSAEVSKDDEAL